ncbi:TIR domain-containing protein [Jeotgalibacillus terrae]|uniref:TIR domain-containing protein n=1 Tax=Jeotgalibacillus terrae TaxID=587735 RepID=A0ABW5ZL07_9BACL|nr:TIR domain-containing protein [Jeotgalibacillus terrae]MBM7578239.1 hypothetical protein [Jeotgalibacillus terrae]
MNDNLVADKVFISYAWSSQEHEEWVNELAERLVSDGVKVVYDKWDSREGQNLNVFMERSVNDSDIKKVLVICDETYMQKANGYEGGVGTETVIISNEVYQDVEQTKFVPIIAQRDVNGKAFIPTYLSGTKYIDMSDEQNYEDGYEKLIRNLYGKPEFVRPQLGQPPAFLLEDEEIVSIESKRALNRFRHMVERKPKSIDILAQEFTTVLIDDFSSYSLEVSDTGQLRKEILKKLHDTIDLRNIYIEFLDIYIRETENTEVIIDFFEEIYPVIMTRKSDSYIDSQFDHMYFFVTEIMLYTVALLYKRKKYITIRDLIQNHYFVSDGRRNLEGSIGIFNKYLRFIEEGLNSPDGKKYISHTGKILLDRANSKTVTKDEIIEADFLIFLLCYRFDKAGGFDTWYPPTYPYFNNENIKFASKIRSKRFFNSCRELFSITTPEEMQQLIEEFKEYFSGLGLGPRAAISISRILPTSKDIAAL